MEHDVVIAVYEGPGIGFVGDAAFTFGVAVAQFETGAFVGDPAVEEEEDGVAPVHVGAVEFEEVLALGHALNDVREVRHAAAFPLGKEGFMAAFPENGVDLFVEGPLAFREQGGRDVDFHGKSSSLLFGFGVGLYL